MEKKRYVKPTAKLYKTIAELPEHLRLQLVNSGPGIIIIDGELRWVHVSDSFAAMLGYEPSALIGKPVEEVTVEQTMDTDFFRKALLELGTVQGLLLLKSLNGSKVLVRYRASRQGTGFFANVERVPLAA